MRTVVSLVLLVVFSAGLLVADDPETLLRVEVRNAKDKPIDRATVILDFLGDRNYMKLGKREKIHYEVHTNQEGIAKFPTIPQGKVRVQVTATRYQTFGDIFEVREAEKTLTVKLKPPQDQYSAH